jgi:phage N-6-adenine-methyltransferase
LDVKNFDQGSHMTRNIAKSKTNTPKDEWRTPSELFNVLNNFFNFTIDAAANEENKLLDRYWSIENPCVINNWTDEVVFCNPPFSELSKDTRWGSKFSTMKKGCVLLPMASDTKWFHQSLGKNGFLYLFRGRVRYAHPNMSSTSPTFPSFLLIRGVCEKDFNAHMQNNGFCGIVLKI